MFQPRNEANGQGNHIFQGASTGNHQTKAKKGGWKRGTLQLWSGNVR